jgi:Flagellar biosynthesis/type III secretory pathway lipoprotein
MKSMFNMEIGLVGKVMDFSQRTIRRELFDPEKTAVRSEQRSEETQQGRSNLEGGSPDANFRGDGISGSASTQNGSRETRTTNYEINKEEQQIVTNVGDLKRMTVAVLIDGTYEKTNGAWTFVPRKADDLERVRQLVTNAVGLDKARGDALEVSSAPFTDSEPPKDPNFAEMLADYAERLGKPLLNALLAFLFLMGIRLPIPVWPSLRTSFFPCRKKKKSTRPSRIPAYLSAGAFCPAPATVSRSSPS